MTQPSAASGKAEVPASPQLTTEPPTKSAPIASNVGKAPYKVEDSQTIGFNPDGSGQALPPANITKADIQSLGKPQTVVKAEPGAFSKANSGKVVVTFDSRANDGDTFNWKPADGSTPPKGAGRFICRLDSVDAPEVSHGARKPGQPYGPEAGAILQQMIADKQVTLTITGKDKRDRDLCQVEIQGKHVDVELVKAGAAWLYREYVSPADPRFNDLSSAENAARTSRSGLWGLPNPVYPQSHRRTWPKD